MSFVERNPQAANGPEMDWANDDTARHPTDEYSLPYVDISGHSNSYGDVKPFWRRGVDDIISSLHCVGQFFL